MAKNYKELYRSFEGKLNASNQAGYIIYEYDADRLLLEDLNVDLEIYDSYYVIPKYAFPEEEYGDLAKIGELESDIDDGCYEDGMVQYRGKWYSGKLIRSIQRDRNDPNWRRYV